MRHTEDRNLPAVLNLGMTGSGVPAAAVLAPQPRRAHRSALAAVPDVVGHRRALAAAAQLPEPALAAAVAAVVPIREHVAAVVLAALQQLAAILGFDPQAHVVFAGMTSVPLRRRQEPASCTRIEPHEVARDRAGVLVLRRQCDVAVQSDRADRYREKGDEQSPKREAGGLLKLQTPLTNGCVVVEWHASRESGERFNELRIPRH
ncbi:hypothetical protein B296_00029789 [Ensete ventricosum]|uniref:Uncharacterized protein n=1 Tax=Ensete ventricosum TaxID=4639 RepID=A0A426Y1L1_ENSVE|nr:hypothetical protein B296_00029789 [Ensete ventricosum]